MISLGSSCVDLLGDLHYNGLTQITGKEFDTLTKLKSLDVVSIAPGSYSGVSPNCESLSSSFS